MIKTNRDNNLYPDFVASSVLGISASELLDLSITHLVLDVDDTIVPRKGNMLSPKYMSHLRSLEQAGITLLIGSNSRRDMTSITADLDAILVPPSRHSFKPLKSYYRAIIVAARTSPDHIAMAGDRIMNDVIGANLTGLTSILVEPYARKLRFLDRWYLGLAQKKARK